MKIHDLARLFACSTSTIDSLVARGVIERVARGEYDPVQCTARYVKHLREVAAGRSSPAAKELQEARAAIVTFRRRRLEREDQQAAGKLVCLDARPSKLAKFIETALLRNPGMLADLLDAAPMLRLEVAERITLPEREPVDG